MGQVYAVAGGKGGVGKTTTTVNLAAAFAAAGYDAVVIDVDLGMANLGPVLDVDPDEDTNTTIHDVLAGRADATAAVRASGAGFDVVPGTQSLDGFAEADPAKLRTVVTPLAAEYDVVLLDTSAGLSHEVTVPLGLADAVVLLTTPDIVAIKDAAKTGELAKRVGGTVEGVVLNRARDDELTERIVDELGDEILAVVPDDPAITAGRAGARPGSGVAQAYNDLAAALLGVDELEETETEAAYAFPEPPEPPTVEAGGLAAAIVPVGGAAVETEAESESEADTADATGESESTDAGEAREEEADAAAEANAVEADAEPTDAEATDGSDGTTDADVPEAEATTEERVEESDSDPVDGDAVATAAGPVTTAAFEEDADAEMGGSFLDDDDEKRRGALGRLRGLFE